jgi:hypothetical protein
MNEIVQTEKEIKEKTKDVSVDLAVEDWFRLVLATIQWQTQIKTNKCKK